MTSVNAAAPFPNRPTLASGFIQWAQSRRAVLLRGQARSAMVMLLLWAALYLVTAATCGLVANALPGVTPFESPRALVRAAVLGLGMAMMVLVVLNLMMQQPPLRRRARRVLARARVLSVRLLRDVFGLAFISGRRLAAAIGLGVVAGFVSVGLGSLLSLVPALAESVPTTDARYEAMAGAPEWVPPVFFATYAPAPEELAYRGLLLAVCAIVLALTSNRWVRGAVVVTGLIGTSWLFGFAHLDWSLLNAVSAGVTGAVFGAVAIATRSLWAAIVAHALFNALPFIV